MKGALFLGFIGTVQDEFEHVWVDRATQGHCRIPEFLRDPFLRLSGQEGLVSRPRP